MITISNERLEEIAEEDNGSDVLFESSVLARELLALRKERERAEPVYQCMDDGKWYDTEKRLYDEVKENGNECRVLYTAPPVADDSLPYDPQIAEYEQMMEAEQSQSDTTSQPLESLAGKAPDGWISCSERMPSENTGVLVATEFDGPGDWRMKWGTRVPGHPDAKNGWFIPGASWTPSHWQPLPEPPCK
ncbi:DUF551 domain-containing protein [Cronobacter sakazakii]|nr:DUF551 domain-containing protein [Cronobacter sakazakii]